MSSADVRDLLAALGTGSLSLEDVATRFRERTWTDQAPRHAQTYLELAAAAQEDPEPDVPGSFDEVTAAYDRGEINREQYRTLAHAVADAINAAPERAAE
jgi:hypothetical protein